MIIEEITGEEEVTERDNLMLVVTGLVVIISEIVTRDVEIIAFQIEDMVTRTGDMDLQAGVMVILTEVTITHIIMVFRLVLEGITDMIMVVMMMLQTP